MSEISVRYEDNDLVPLLRNCNDQELETLVEYITQQGKISSELETTNKYKEHHPKHSFYCDYISGEIQKYGGNTIVNIFRGKGVFYKEIVCDVADKLKVNYNSKQDTSFIEMQILLKILEKSWEKMTDVEKRELLKSVGTSNEVVSLPKTVPLAVQQAAIKMGEVGSYMMAVIIANAVARQLLGKGVSFFATSTALRSGLSILAGPIGLAVMGILTVLDLAGPAYRVTIPCVIHIAMLRQRLLVKQKQPSLL